MTEEEPLDPNTRYFTNGELSTFKQCRRKWWLSSYRKLAPATEKLTGPLADGTRVHAALAGIYDPHAEHDPVQILLDLAARDRKILQDREVNPEEMKAFEEGVSLTRIMVEGYLEWLEETGSDAGFEFIGPEQRVIANPMIPELPNVRLLGKQDVRIRQIQDGARMFSDHKTLQTFASVEQTAHLNEQFLHYNLLEFLGLYERGENLDVRTDGVLINMLRKVKRTAKAKPPFYKRLHLRPNRQTLESYWIRVVEVIRQIVQTTARLDAGEDPRAVAYPTPTNDCVWKCEFYRLCPMFDDGSNAEGYIRDQLIMINPLKRYEPESIGVVN